MVRRAAALVVRRVLGFAMVLAPVVVGGVEVLRCVARFRWVVWASTVVCEGAEY